MSQIDYNLGNPNSPKLNLFGYVLIISGILSLVLGYFYPDAIGLGVVGLVFGGVVVTSYDGVIIDMGTRKLKGYTSFYGYKYGDWENLRNYGSVSMVISHRIWKLKYLGDKSIDVTPREFVVCLLGKSHRKRQNLKRFDSQQEAQKFIKAVSTELNLPVERYQPPSMS